MKIQRSLGVRFLLFTIAVFVAFGSLLFFLYRLQIARRDLYQVSAVNERKKTIRLTGKRGMITDADSVVLAQSDPVYNVTFLMNSAQNKAADYKAFTNSILQVMELLKKYDRAITLKPVIVRSSQTNLIAFDFGDPKRISQKALEKREMQWRKNHYLTNLKLYPDAQACYNKLVKDYQMLPLQLDEAVQLQLISVYSEMRMNLFNSMPVVIAGDVPFSAVSEITGRSMSLPGIDIGVGEKRVYPRGALASQVVGYIGPISESDDYEKNLKSMGYALNDTIGKDGVEKSMENWLTAFSGDRQGYRIMEKDNNGRLTRQLDYSAPVDGNNVKLTIIAAYQQQAERAIAKNVERTRKVQEKKMFSDRWLESTKDKRERRDFNEFPLKLASTGTIVVLEVNTGRVLAMAQYPTYDLNAMVAGGPQAWEIMKDERNILQNYAIHSKAEPGSIFKMVTSMAALTNQKLGVTETISDEGPFTKVTKKIEEAPVCWIPKGQRYLHSNQTIVQGLTNSCNYFFYELAYRLYGEDKNPGQNLLYKYAAQMGLTTKTGVQLPGEARGVVGCQTSLYDPTVSLRDQETNTPDLVSGSIKKHLRNIGASYGVTYNEDRLNACVKQLMDMALKTHSDKWADAMRPILMAELNMTRDMVWKQAVIGDIWVYLNDIKWGASLEVQMGIGQSITLVTPAAVSRYAASLANGGIVYNLSIIDSIISPEGEVLNQYQPSVFGQLPGAREYLPYIREGMKGVVDADANGTAKKYFKGWKYQDDIWAKTGTSQVTVGKIKLDLENNGWFVALAPYKTETEIAVVTLIPNGLSGGETTLAAQEFIAWWMENKVKSTDAAPVTAGNELMP